MKKLIPLVFTICLLMTGCANKQVIDTNNRFTYAYVNTGSKIIEGKVDSWTDFEDGDQLQVKINGVTYLSSSTNIVLVYDPNL